MPISSLIARTDSPENASLVANVVSTIPRCSVERIEGNDLIILTETSDTKEDKAIWDQLEGLGHIQSLELIYHNFEDLEESES